MTNPKEQGEIEFLESACSMLRDIQRSRKDIDRIREENREMDIGRRNEILRAYYPYYRDDLRRILMSLEPYVLSLPLNHELRNESVGKLEDCRFHLEEKELDTKTPDGLINGYIWVENELSKLLNNLKPI